MTSYKLRIFCLSAFATAILTQTALAAPLQSPATVRSGPGPAYPVIAQIPAKTDVQILTCAEGWRRLWCQVQYGDVTGWVKGVNLAPDGNGGKVWVAPVLTSDIANLRKGPGVNWPVVAEIPANVPVDMHNCATGWHTGWCKVSYQGLTGYVNSALLHRQGQYQ
jgi:uncharacterized protein YraI